MKKIIAFIFVALSIFVVSLTTSCEYQSVKKLKVVVEKVQSECPISMGMMGDVLDVKYLPQSHEVQIYYNINKAVIDVDVLSQNKELLQNNVKLGFSKGEPRKLIEMIADANAGLKLVYKNASTSNKCEVSCSPEDLKEMIANPLSDAEINEMIIKNQLAIENSRCPYPVEVGVVMKKVVNEEGSIIYYAELDEEMYDIRAFKDPEVMTQMRASIEELFSDPMSVAHIKILNSLNKGVIYRYVGSNSGQKVDIAFTPNDLKAFDAEYALK